MLIGKYSSFQDPFEMNVKKRAKGTFDEPTLIPSMMEKRLVGCICKYLYLSRTILQIWIRPYGHARDTEWLLILDSLWIEWTLYGLFGLFIS